ncbi:MAG: hypothetical protein ACI97K_000455 [Glaciecola sp.]|jgi:hypothetical protein
MNFFITLIAVSIVSTASISSKAASLGEFVKRDESATLNQTVHLDKFEILNSSAGYPFDRLIIRVDIIKTIYSIDGNQVACSVLLQDSDLKQRSPTVQAGKVNFEEEPLANCLPRNAAKKWLSNTY